MLGPAILYKNEIEKHFAEVMYSDDYFYYMGYVHGHELPKVEPADNVYQWAIVNKDNEVIGWFAYRIDPTSDSVYNFGLYSFDKGNVLVGKDVFEKMEELITKHRRVEWRVIEGNPVIRSYDKLCQRHNGHKAVLHKVAKGPDGMYRNEYVYEILSESEGRE
jgi:hypothetical protein